MVDQDAVVTPIAELRDPPRDLRVIDLFGLSDDEVRQWRELPYASLPVVFAAHQLIEAFVCRQPDENHEELYRFLLRLVRDPTVAEDLVSDVFFDGEAKEAVAFAFLGWLHHRRRPGNVVGATGARGPRILGKRTPA